MKLTPERTLLIPPWNAYGATSCTSALKLSSTFYSHKYDCIDTPNLSPDISFHCRIKNKPIKGSPKKNMIST